MILPRYRVEFNNDAFKTLGDAAAKYGTLAKAPNAGDLLPSSDASSGPAPSVGRAVDGVLSDSAHTYGLDGWARVR